MVDIIKPFMKGQEAMPFFSCTLAESIHVAKLPLVGL